jgi:Ni/Co efflux regulator RcnB
VSFAERNMSWAIQDHFRRTLVICPSRGAAWCGREREGDREMKKILIGVLAASSLAAAMPATAATWQTVNSRQNQLFAKIDQGVRTGGLTRYEANNLRNQFYGIARLEASYRRGGLSSWERNDLMRRLNALDWRIRNQRHDSQRRY